MNRIEILASGVFLNGKNYRRGFHTVGDEELKAAEEVIKKFPKDIKIHVAKKEEKTNSSTSQVKENDSNNHKKSHKK